LVLVKPQFELPPKFVKKGVVKDDEKKAASSVGRGKLSKGAWFFCAQGLSRQEPRGTKGNEEFFVFAKRGEKGIENLEGEVWNAVKEPL
jgi:23S rRNA (cytidine1920-2'-O)/16S rRNA (cytidine1409-2'-O)-methyltransferase